MEDEQPRGWLTLLNTADASGLDAVVACVNPRARARPIDPDKLAIDGPAPVLAWEIEIDESVSPREESNWARATRVSSVAGFQLRSGRVVSGE